MKSNEPMLQKDKNASRYSMNRLYFYMIHNPVNILYSGLFMVVLLFSYQNTFSTKKQLHSSFSGKIEFEGEQSHRLLTQNVTATYQVEGGVKVLTIKATDDNNLESVFIRLLDVNGTGTYFIPGSGRNNNVGNIIKNLNNYNDKDNFYVATLPNAEGILSGVGRINITKLDDEVVEGNLILISNNPKGEQAVLESARFSIAIN
jgi:hypothetical protein